MPLWKVYHPVGAYSARDKKEFAEQVTAMYSRIPIPNDWEVTIDEVPADLWSLQGEIPPPFESHVEKRWVRENRVSPYGLQEKLPVGALFTPGVTEKS